MPELHEMTALEQAEAVRSRRVSPVELVEHYLDRIERRNAELGAFITVTGEDALAAGQGGRGTADQVGPGDRCRRCSACRPRSRTST